MLASDELRSSRRGNNFLKLDKLVLAMTILNRSSLQNLRLVLRSYLHHLSSSGIMSITSCHLCHSPPSKCPSPLFPTPPLPHLTPPSQVSRPSPPIRQGPLHPTLNHFSDIGHATMTISSPRDIAHLRAGDIVDECQQVER